MHRLAVAMAADGAPLFPLLLLRLLLLTTPSSADPRATEAAHICGSRRSSDAVSFVQNFVSDMAALAGLVSSAGWGIHLANSSSSSVPVYGLAQCHSDLSPTDCLLCFSECRTRLPRCLPNVSARVFLDGCFLRYDSYPFYSEAVDPALDTAVCGGTRVGGVPGEEEPWRRGVVGLLGNLTEAAAGNGGFAVREDAAAGVYGLAECWETVGAEGCRECLGKAGREVAGCLPAREGRGLNAGCYLRYSDSKFYSATGQNGGGSSKKVLIFALVPPIALVVVLSSLFVWICYRRQRNMKKESRHLLEIYAPMRKSHLHFKYEILERSTDHFNPTKKLGQGGAGSVYKGTLPDGRNVAVKRLFFNGRQWADEFFNEVNLISKLQHKNLVKLLGCSIEGPESLLVYEYIPNTSLDRFLFGKGNNYLLTWEQRFQIILGVAEGLAYLHRGPETRIIHRDIKCSNILLDDNLNARIADFGLARRFSVDQSHVKTGVAGTLGYVAPEYVIQGILTDKADVYSFGILVLEVLCGMQNNIFARESVSVLRTVWKHYIAGTLMECLDQSLKGEIPAEEASYVFQVGLLCTQASVTLRPSAPEVVEMLSSRTSNIQMPTQPPFIELGSVDTSPS
ncbi:hypothetical protein Taro_040572 [Colocasia esculenta]|uniref:Cysteine-rich receptor-like protein kinase 42 n=1 Tax=Colocasia esculenta TaxID=4460 RepID=A0A843WC75_COLES|nr:hypothetical protein [Colocasia esculenta]